MNPVTHEVKFPSGSGQLEGYLAQPEGEGPFPGLVVIHEAYGLNENIRDVARRLAGEGYAALAVDLFAGRNRALCIARFFANFIFNWLNNASINELKATLSYLAAQPGVDETRLGAIGLCMGGTCAIAWAGTDDRLKAIAPFYGMNPRPLTAVERACPIVGSYPAEDFTARAGQTLDLVLDRTSVPHDIKVYPDSKHSFFNDRSQNHNPEAASDAWQRVLSFFKTHVG